VQNNNDGVITKYQNGLGIDNKLKLTTNGVSKYFLQDHLGSTIGLAKANGTLNNSASYDSFGNLSGTMPIRYHFTGREYDADIGLHYYRARWYDSKLGRFISEDPIGFAGGDVNLYGYVGNNPIQKIDPLGLQETDVIILNSPPFNNPKPINRNTNCLTNECQQSVDQIINTLNQTRDWMDANGTRVPNASGTWNNIRSSINGIINFGSSSVGYGDIVNPYGGCQWQASQLIERLNVPAYKFEYGHDFMGVEDVNPRYFTFPMTDTPLTTHKWVKATPRNPNYPKLKLDTWNNSWEVIP
jgi:RHS repeat-associated protein